MRRLSGQMLAHFIDERLFEAPLHCQDDRSIFA